MWAKQVDHSRPWDETWGLHLEERKAKSRSGAKLPPPGGSGLWVPSGKVLWNWRLNKVMSRGKKGWRGGPHE